MVDKQALGIYTQMYVVAPSIWRTFHCDDFITSAITYNLCSKTCVRARIYGRLITVFYRRVRSSVGHICRSSLPLLFPSFTPCYKRFFLTGINIVSLGPIFRG